MSGLAREILSNWVDKMEEGGSTDRSELKNRFYKLRVKGLELSRIAEQLGVNQTVVSGWDDEVRSDSKAWGATFSYLRKTTDPLAWEMKVMDAFHELWGSRPPG